jgi:1-acyl-sn-glycerol-3-phosphate acyltransferase
MFVYNFIRSIIGVFVLVAGTIFWCGLGWILTPVWKQPKLGTFIMRGWCYTLLKSVAVKLKVSGLENLPTEPGLIAFNHTSHFDIPALVCAIPRDIRFGAKIELFSVPIFGQTMKLFGMLPITRSNREKVLEVYRQSVVRIRNGETFCLAPEGTRQDGSKLGTFKRGPFIFAVEAQCKITPVVIRGAHKVVPKGDWIVNRGRWSSDVEILILPAIDAKGCTPEDVDRLCAQTSEVMTRAYTGV